MNHYKASIDKLEDAIKLLKGARSEQEEYPKMVAHEKYGSIGVRLIEGERWFVLEHLERVFDFDPPCSLLDYVKFTDVIMLQRGILLVNMQGIEDIVDGSECRYALEVIEWLSYEVNK